MTEGMADAVATTDPVDPVAVLRMLTEGLAATEASIVRLQAVREAHLAVAQREDGGSSTQNQIFVAEGTDQRRPRCAERRWCRLRAAWRPDPISRRQDHRRAAKVRCG